MLLNPAPLPSVRSPKQALKSSTGTYPLWKQHGPVMTGSTHHRSLQEGDVTGTLVQAGSSHTG
jgi:hypothetical protein